MLHHCMCRSATNWSIYNDGCFDFYKRVRQIGKNHCNVISAGRKNREICFTFLSYFASQRSNNAPAYYMYITLSKINIWLTLNVIMSCLYSKTEFKQLKQYD